MIDRRFFIALAALFSAAMTLATPLWPDIDGSQDHPVTGRYEGSEITGYSSRAFDAISVWTGDAETLEGEVTEIAYRMPEGVTMIAAQRNYASRLEAQGYTAAFDCNAKTDRKTCSRDLAYGITRLPDPRMIVDSFNFAYSLYRGGDDGRSSIALLASENNGRAYVQVSIIQLDALEFRMVDAAAIDDELTALGHIALYGIRFDTNSARLTPGSMETLAELAKYLQANPQRNIMIVGHTDNQGTLDYNIGLSSRRAEAVRDHLIGTHGISADLMRAAGVGFLAPVASNRTSDGRAQNRRVEIVAR